MIRSSSTVLALTALLVAAATAVAEPLQAQLPDHPLLAEGYLAWDRGDYDVALERYLEVLRGPDAERHLPEVARLTGEPFQVTELAPDGSDIQVSPDGGWASWEVEDPDEGTVTEVVALSEPDRVVATLPGGDVRISAGGQAVYATVRPSQELEAARAEMDEARGSGDRNAFFEARNRVEWHTALGRELRVRDLRSGDERTLDTGEDWLVGEAVFAPDSEDLFVVAIRRAESGSASPSTAPESVILHVRDGQVRPLDAGGAYPAEPLPVRGGRWLVAEASSRPALPMAPDASAQPPAPARTGLLVHDLRDGGAHLISRAGSPAVAADGSLLAFLTRNDDGQTLVRALRLPGSGTDAATGAGPLRPEDAVTLLATEMDVSNPAVSPDGAWVAYQKRPIHDWEIFAMTTGVDDGSGAATPGEEIQVTREIQHDLYPAFVDETTILAAKGEGRHRRSFLYDLASQGGPGASGSSAMAGPAVTKLFHNNTVRTIAPEYEWVATPDGRGVMLVSERDGDTVSPERAVYLVHLDRPVTLTQVRERLERELEAERDLRTLARTSFEPIADRVREITERVDVGRIYEHAKVLHSFDSKYITQPGNRLASQYITQQLESWGYEPELQWFEPRPGVRTANVIARLPGTRNPDLVYVVSSHYDSVERGPGADDNSSGTTALLEAARVMAERPQPATIEFAFFTGEEAGLLGSREYVRRAVESGKRIVGALNNDMVGFANDHRLDNTIRYSNRGIRDIQHGAAILFSDLITYDALYYKSTDAHAYYEEYGDIVGGIGSYPVLGSPFYHQFTDRLNTINQRLVAEVSRVTGATLVHLASSPSRVTGLRVERLAASGESTGDAGQDVRVRWDPAPEEGITGYRIEWTDTGGTLRSTTVAADGAPEARLEDVASGSTLRVKAKNDRGMEGWDWARVEVP